MERRKHTGVLTLRLRTTLVILSKNWSLQYSYHRQCNSHTYAVWTATFAERFTPVRISDIGEGRLYGEYLLHSSARILAEVVHQGGTKTGLMFQ
jgi:hypothetical protein